MIHTQAQKLSITASEIRAEFGIITPFKLSAYYRGASKVPDITSNSNISKTGYISFGQFYGSFAYIPPGTNGTNEFSVPGTYVLNLSENTTHIEIFGIGGGGGGGGAGEPGATAGGGGGAGGWFITTIQKVPNVNQVTIIVGSGGEPGLGTTKPTYDYVLDPVTGEYIQVMTSAGNTQSNGGAGTNTTIIYNGISFYVGGGGGGFCTAAGRGGGVGGSGGNIGNQGNWGAPVTSSSGGAGASSAYNIYVNGSVQTGGSPGYYNWTWVGGNGNLGGGGGGGSGSHDGQIYYNGGYGGNGYARVRF